MQIRIAVRVSGEILLSGKAAERPEIQAALEAADPRNDFVLYYRESPQTSPPPHAMQVLDLIRSHRFAISFSTLPDFSDYVDRFGQSHPRLREGWPHPVDPFVPWMPDVDLAADLQNVFAEMRAGESQGVVIVRPDRATLLLQNSPSSPRIDELLRQLPSFIPLGQSRNIAAIANTEFTMLNHAVPPGMKEAGRAIPFLGLLMGWAQAGHRVWLFEGHSSALAAALEGADYLLVDSGMLPYLQEDWMAVARRSMNPEGKVLHYNRENRNILPVAVSSRPPGWRFSEPDGEASYANCLLTLLAKSSQESAEIQAGEPVPNLAGFTEDPEELEWVVSLPFRYEALDAQKVIEVLLNAAAKGKPNPLDSEWVLSAKVVSAGKEPKTQTFIFRLDAENRLFVTAC